MTSTRRERHFMKHARELEKIIKGDIKSFNELMSKDKSFKREVRNAKRQLKLIRKLIYIRKSSYTL